MRIDHRLFVVATVVASLAGCERPPQVGVEVFSTDTLPVTFTVSPTGSLGLSVRAGAVHVQPDKSLLLSTPAELRWAQGDGAAKLEGAGSRRLAVKPIGFSPDSADTTTVEGRVVMLTIPPARNVVILKAEKP